MTSLLTSEANFDFLPMIGTIQSMDDHYILQEDLNSLTSWARAFNMEFNIPKCNIIQVTTLCNKSSFTYSMNGIPLQIVEQHLCLGVYLHHRMSWQPQVDYVCNKANRILGFLWRNLHGSSIGPCGRPVTCILSCLS